MSDVRRALEILTRLTSEAEPGAAIVDVPVSLLVEAARALAEEALKTIREQDALIARLQAAPLALPTESVFAKLDAETLASLSPLDVGAVYDLPTLRAVLAEVNYTEKT